MLRTFGEVTVAHVSLSIFWLSAEPGESPADPAGFFWGPVFQHESFGSRRQVRHQPFLFVW